jgi:hypothetical protein
MTNLIKTKVADYGLTNLIQRLGRDCSPTQFVREFAMNGIEAIQRTKKPGQIIIDANWDFYEKQEIHKMCFIDTGDGMTCEEMQEHLNNLSSSGSEKNVFENYGMGAKIAALTRNHAGIIYDSWKNGDGNRIIIKFDDKEKSYGIAPVNSGDGTSQWCLTLDESSKPAIIGKSGTRVTLLGSNLDEDTMAPPPGIPGGKENWVYQYLNTRFFRLPSDIDIQVRIGYFRDQANKRHNYTRKVEGQKSLLDSYATHSGEVLISDAKIHWWILKSDRQGHGREFIRGHTGCVHQDELFDLADGRSNRAAGFGIIFGREHVVIYVEPKSGYVQDTTRTRLLQQDGSALPWDRWQDEFRQKMPPDLEKFQKDMLGAAENKSHADSIRERLRSIANFFKISRYRKAETGSIEADPDTETRSQTGTGTRSTQGHGSYRRTDAGDAAGAIEEFLMSGVKPGGVTAVQANPDKFPEVRWISLADKTRAPEELEDRAAEYLEKDNIIRANADFQGFTDIVAHFTGEYAEIEGSEAIIKSDVHEVFEQQLIEVVAGALSFRNRPRWNPEQFKQAVSQEALTSAVMCRYHLVNQIRRSIGGKLGKASKA